jgi:glucose-1-phosphate cytidylyltransferase
MKAVVLAGGLGSRLSEETTARPKPMVEIGGKPILWHILKIYSSYGINDFIICLGYKGYMVKEYFANYHLHTSDLTIDLANNRYETHQNTAEPWRVTLVDTGDATMTGGRLRRVREYLKDEETFCFTYGDGLSNIDVNKLIEFHKKQGTLATVTAAQPSGRFGGLTLAGEKVASFMEKPQGDGRWVSSGFFVLSPKIFDYLDSDSTIWEREPVERLAREGQLSAYKHTGFFQPMDTMFDRNLLEQHWASGHAPWKVWE